MGEKKDFFSNFHGQTVEFLTVCWHPCDVYVSINYETRNFEHPQPQLLIQACLFRCTNFHVKTQMKRRHCLQDSYIGNINKFSITSSEFWVFIPFDSLTWNKNKRDGKKDTLRMERGNWNRNCVNGSLRTKCYNLTKSQVIFDKYHVEQSILLLCFINRTSRWWKIIFTDSNLIWDDIDVGSFLEI